MFPALEQVSPATFAAARPRRRRAPRSAPGCCAPRCGSGSGASAGPFRSLARLAVEPRAYQLVPLLMALRQDTVRLLIADDVGIGKTVEAGLIAAELLEQGDAHRPGGAVRPGARRAVAAGAAPRSSASTPSWCCPAPIRGWNAACCTARPLFDRYPTRRGLHRLHQAPRRCGEQFWHGCPDLVIVDEAHTCVSDGTGGRSRMLRARAGHRPGQGRQPAPDPGHRHPAQRQGGGFPQPARPARARTWSTWTWNRSQGRERLARHFVQRRRADIRSLPRRVDTPFPEDRLTQERTYTLSPAYKELFDDVLALRPRNRPRPRRRPAAAAGPVLVGAGAAAGAGLLAAGGRRHAAHPGRQPRRRRTWPRPTGSAAPPCSTCPTRRPSSPPTPPRARTATPRTATPRTAGG